MTPWIGIALGVVLAVLIVGSIAADLRDERAHEQWMRRWQEWLDGGMKGPRP